MDQNYPYTQTNGASTFMTAVVGGVIGAAAALIFSDEKRRQQAVQAAKDLPSRMMDMRSDFERKTDDVVDKVRRGTERAASKVKEKAEQVEEDAAASRMR